MIERELEGLALKGINRTERKEEEEEEERNKRKRSRDVTNLQLRLVPTLFLFLCSSCGSWLVLLLTIEHDLCTLRGPPCYYEHIHLLHRSSIIFFFFVKFNLNRSLVS